VSREDTRWLAKHEPFPGDDQGVFLSVVVPCYNEEDSISELYSRLSAACVKCAGESYELILVNDGSKDNTWSALTRFAGGDSHIIAVDLARNHGHQLALTAGLSICRGQRILIIDADLQDPPELLPDMMRLMEGGADVVYGQRTERQGETRFKKATASTFYWLIERLSDVAIPQDTGDFRLISRRVLQVLQRMPEGHRFIRGMIAWIGFMQLPLPYKREPRFAGRTKYPFRRMLRFAMDAITGFSTFPLRISLYVSIAFMFLAVLLGAYVFYSVLMLNAVHGWASILLVILIFSSVQLLCLGIIGEYLGRIYLETKSRPLFVVRQLYRRPPTEKIV